MKKVILTLLCAACSMVIVNAQDSTRTQTAPKSATSSAYQNYPTKDMKKVAISDVPASLRTTLQGEEFKGWENGTVYLNSTTNEYYLSVKPSKKEGIGATGTANKATWYRFDQSGKRIPESGIN